MTRGANLSPKVRELLATRVDTFEKLDMIVALSGAPHRSLTVDELAVKLGYSKSTTRQTIGDLRRVMLVDLTSRGDAQLMPLTEADRLAIEELVEAHRADRSVIVQTLAELALGRIRGMAAKAFADAFVLGRRKKGDSDG